MTKQDGYGVSTWATSRIVWSSVFQVMMTGGGKTLYVVFLTTLRITGDGVMSEICFWGVKCHVVSSSSHAVFIQKAITLDYYHTGNHKFADLWPAHASRHEMCTVRFSDTTKRRHPLSIVNVLSWPDGMRSCSTVHT
jgi:hypothetical protein